MPNPVSKTKPLGKPVGREGLTEADIQHLMKRTKKKKVVAVPRLRKLGPGVHIPDLFHKAHDILFKKLITSNLKVPQDKKKAGLANITGMHIGQKEVGGKPTGSLAVVVTVRKKIKDSGKIHSKFRIPKQIKVGKVAVPVDVKLGHNVKPQAMGGEQCQLSGGRFVGTIGCFVTFDLGSNRRGDFLLTNNHVIGRFVNGQPDENTTADDVVDAAGTVIANQLIVCGTLNGSDGLSVDAAIASAGPNPPDDCSKHVALRFSSDFLTMDKINSEVELGAIWTTFGAVSKQKLSFKVDNLPSFQQVDYSKYPIGRPLNIRGVIVLKPVGAAAEDGDSGALYIDQDGNPAAIHIGTDESTGLAFAALLATIHDDLPFDAILSVS